jgi:hypothetical protein
MPADLRCAPRTRRQEVDPLGSAPTFEHLVLVETPLPWPTEVTDLPTLAHTPNPGTRIMAVVPEMADPSGLIRLTHWRRTTGNSFSGLDRLVRPGDVPGLLRRLAEDPAASADTVTGAAPAEVLICSHGRRDRCCGRLGTQLAVATAQRWPGVRVRRCSHTGGHRFAPTGITLPDGHCWAYLDVDVLDGLVDRTAALPRLLPHLRGACALDRWAQVVDRALFERLGWAWWSLASVEASTAVAPDGASAKVRLEWTSVRGGGRADATVEIRREIPIVPCGEPAGASVETVPELSLRELMLRPE